MACDILTVDTVLLRTLYVLVFIEIHSRRILYANCSFRPNSAWVTQQARNLTWELSRLEVPVELAIHDRDGPWRRGAGGTRWRRRNTSDCGRRNPVAQLEQLALDPAIAPAWVLAPEAEDHLSEFLRGRGAATARTETEGGPMLTHQLAVPTEQGGWREHQPPGRQSQAQSGEDKAIRHEIRPLHLTAQNGHLMAESEDLEVTLRVRAGRERRDADRQPDQHINGRVEQEAGE